jgi:hypothetical protein
MHEIILQWIVKLLFIGLQSLPSKKTQCINYTATDIKINPVTSFSSLHPKLTLTCTFPFTCGSSIAVDDHSVLAGTSLLKKMKDKNTTLSEQYHNQIWKSQKEEKPMHLTHKYKQYHILILLKYLNTNQG